MAHDDAAFRATTRNISSARSVPARVTVERWKPHLPSLGITRVADVTGMDCVGIPTVVVTRPSGRSLSVSQGKGVDLDSAKASGIMEAIEQLHAETIDLPLRLASAQELASSRRVVSTELLPRFVKDFSPHVRTLWIEARCLTEDGSLWVPYELVNLNFTLPLPEGSGYFVSGSNGLASGNELSEALCHGLCEVVERDALSLFYATPADHQRARRLAVATVDDAICAGLLLKFDEAGIDVAVWDATSDLGVPTFLCQILERPEECLRPVGIARGSGTHPDPRIALARALCEAAQSRLTRIVGSRDDLQADCVRALRAEEVTSRHRALMADLPEAPLSFATMPDLSSGSVEADTLWILRRLREAGLEEACYVDLSRPELPGSVTKVIVPGLEGVPGHRGGRTGSRLAAHRGRFEAA